ncbi:MAG: DNA polymerase Y family protein, partial [Nakamurella sp.]
ITAITERGAKLSRVWRCAQPLTAAATADRLRWQLDGWLTAGRTAARKDTQPQVEVEGPGAISLLILEPIEAIGAGHIQYGLWGSDGQDDQRAGWAFARVQGLLGPESVLAPVLAGGRSAVDRITLVPWGDERVSSTSPGDPWPGSLPAPSPSRVSPARAMAVSGTSGPTAHLTITAPEVIAVLDTAGRPVQLTGRGLLSGSPAWLGQPSEPGGKHQRVDAWAGPWLLDERWWSTQRRSAGARVQVITEGGVAMLLRSTTDGWQVEGVYD